MTSSQPPLTTDLAARLAAAQRAERLPALVAAAGRGSELIFVGGAGAPLPSPEQQFRIGSISKTFTAVLIMQLRDEGRLGLDDPLERHLPGTCAGHLTIRALLSHTSGLTAEPLGPFWEATGRTADELLAGLRPADLVLAPGEAFHYSNVAFGLLGLVIERLRGASWRAVLTQRLLDPLELRSTSYAPTAQAAQGWRVHPFADALQPEPHADTGAMAPAGQLWSTPSDLVRWGLFLAAPVPEVLSADTVAEMAEPVMLSDRRGWTAAYGLGLELVRVGERVLIGHGGSMPGFAAGLLVARGERVAGAAMTNVWGGRAGGFLREMVQAVLAADSPPDTSAWQAEDVPAELQALLGPWYYRGLPLAVTFRAGRLYLGLPDNRAPTDSFVASGPDTFRATGGARRGETLQVIRDAAGVPVVLELNTWLLTRSPDDPRGGP